MNNAVKAMIEGTTGRIFTVVYYKKDGSRRTMNARIGAKRGQVGAGLHWDPEKRGYMVVRDVKKRDYRMVNLDTVEEFRFQGQTWRRAA